MNIMKILVACEESQIVTKAFRDKGHEAYSCDILPTSGANPEWHIQTDIKFYLGNVKEKWDMLIAFPPCTYICGSGWFRSVHDPERMKKSVEAIEFVKYLWGQDIPKICIENPVGKLSSEIRKPNQYIQPHWFGDDASKKTGLWLKGLPELKRTKQVPPRIVEVNGKKYKRWANQTDSGQNNLGPSKDRALLRSKTYPGIADCMAETWG